MVSNVTQDPLEELERHGVPHADPHSDAEALAAYILSLLPADQAAVIEALPRWLMSGDPAREVIAVNLAVLLRNERLMRAAIREARNITSSVHETLPWPPPLPFVVIAAVGRYPVDEGLAYLRELCSLGPAGRGHDEMSRRACVVLALTTGDHRAIERMLTELRSAGDGTITRSVLTQLAGYSMSDPVVWDLLTRILTPSERRYVESYRPIGKA